MAKQNPRTLSLLSKIKSVTFVSLIPLIFITSTQLSSIRLDNFHFYYRHLDFDSTWLIMIVLSVVPMLSIVYFLSRPRPVYLVNFACYKPDNACKCTKKALLDLSRGWGTFNEESLEFQKKLLEKSGLGDDTYLPEALLRVPCNPCFTESRKEIEVLMFGAIDDLFAKTEIKVKEIGIVIVNCGLFNPTPSLSATVVNRFKLRSDVLSYNLAGMGCSAGVISIDLAKNLLRVHKNTCALVVSVEAGSTNWYLGNERSMLVSNCVFRIGGAAILLSNKRSDKSRSKYRLSHTVRTNKGGNDKSFDCVRLREDSEGKIGISLSKDLMVVAGDALRANMTALGPLVLPLSEKLTFLGTLIAKKVFKVDKLKPYVPNFKLAFEHFCIHAGGRGVLDAVHKNLTLTDWLMEPSRMTLYRFGNTSSTSIWYELAYIEAKGRVKKGDRVWQIAFGSGFKCNSVVWKALRNVNPAQEMNAWTDEIHLFPVDIPN
ncbi:hypothetical protein RND81_01G182300 [Saponaria officinalis]|uniref:3-ketoacyl-CoA synthase n=1 Tax=Saponaria officinalis TaxID=3572 RepID=A0AAW1NI30_SAPOF